MVKSVAQATAFATVLGSDEGFRCPAEGLVFEDFENTFMNTFPNVFKNAISGKNG